MGRQVGVVREIWRYPVKSMGGEQLHRQAITWTGAYQDRVWAVVRKFDDTVITAKMKEGQPLLDCHAFVERANHFMVCFSDMEILECGDPRTDERLSELLGFDVALVNLQEYPWIDRETNYLPPFRLRLGVGYDSSPIHLISESTLESMHQFYPEGDWKVRRFRPTWLIEVLEMLESFPEDDWTGCLLSVGSAIIFIRKPTVRCPEITQAQSLDIPHDGQILRAIKDHHGGNLGVYAVVVQPGLVVLGDEIRLLTPVEHALV